MAKHDFDIVIVGGGMVGSAFAAALRGLDFRVAVVETALPAPFAAEQPPDLRVSALNIAAEKLLMHCKAWDKVLAMRACPYRYMQVNDGEAGGETFFDAADLGATHLGHIVENRVLQLALLAAIDETPEVTLIAPAKLQHMEVFADHVHMQLDNGQHLSTALVVGADGAGSFVRRCARIDVERHSYQMQAMVATVSMPQAETDITWQRFMPTGPQAFLPLAKGYGSLVWYHQPEAVAQLKTLSDEDFLQALVDAFPERLGAVTQVLARGGFGLQRQHARQYVRPRVALIGDAAHAVHPLAGQGVNLGLLDAAALVEALWQESGRQGDPGRLSTLRRYERARRLDNSMMLWGLHGFERAFAPRPAPLRRARSALMSLGNRWPLLKHQAMRQAMGLGTHLPRLAQGRPLY